MLNKKGISPVVATALLLVVAVVAVVGYQNWFTGFQSGLETDVEQRSSGAAGSVNVEFISSDGIIYVTNTGTENISMSTIKIGDTDCLINQNLTPGVNNISVASCLNSTGTNEIFLVTENGIIKEKLFVEEIALSSSLDCSSLNLIGGEWVTIQENSILGTSSFCVMKYEAKNVGGIPASQASLDPWGSISQLNSRTKCNDLGEGYHLVTDSEWVTIAREIENVPSNWFGGILGINFMFTGHNDNFPGSLLNATINDANMYYRTGDNLSNCDGSFGTGHLIGDDTISGRACAGQRRTLALSNGESIWDISGNAWEWTNDSFSTNVESSLGKTESVYDWTQISGYDYLEPFNPTYDETFGTGKIYVDATNANPSGTIHAFMRGGSIMNGIEAGSFALYLKNSPTFTSSVIGFRCTYTP